MKKLIFKDVKAEAAFIAGVESARDRCNELTDLFNNMQPWERINNVEAFKELVTDPGAYYDRVLLSNVQLTGGMRPNPEVLARLFDLPRQEFLNICAGVSYNIEGCASCQKVKRIRRGKPCISLAEYRRQSDYLIFNAGDFQINEEAVNRHAEAFNTYAETSGQVEIVTHWETLINVLNSHAKLYPIPQGSKQTVAKALGLNLSHALYGDFMLTSETLKNLIQKI